MPETRVKCRSEFTFAQQPQRFTWEDQWLEIIQVIERQRTPEGFRFRVQTDADTFFTLCYDESHDKWLAELLLV